MDELADDMYRDMAAHVAATWDSIRRETKDYRLMNVKNEITEKVKLPGGAKLVSVSGGECTPQRSHTVERETRIRRERTTHSAADRSTKRNVSGGS